MCRKRARRSALAFAAAVLGLLHLDIVQQRLEREYGLEILTTLPNTEYRAVTTGGKSVAVDTPAQLPDPSDLDRIEEPWVELNLITPSGYIGGHHGLVRKSARRVQGA